MELIWISEEERIIQELGLLKKGEKFQTTLQLGKQLISQNLAKEIKEEKKKSKTSK